ncbi:MAG: Gfo/Idh/MocA family oxidoreductase [Oscillospiraceae bacterium]|jgi:predicted dehydrogenase|nr:Gfo/Idh/MocA family oxidoreductase [Oscillospiraceae bacterium]
MLPNDRNIRIGFVGVGNISGIYLENITKNFKEIEIIGVCDLVREKAERAVKQYNIPKLYNDMYELFADPEVDIVLNITRPYEHYEVSKAALEAGKPVYSEKPLAATLEEGKALLELAKEKGLALGGAPDTFLGAGIQGAKKLLADGLIGDVIGGALHMICHGHETWHPDPAFYYDKIGGGPMLDMGPYYVTAAVNLIGPVQAVTGFTKSTYPTRLITSQPLNGTVIDVGCPTYYQGVLKFVNGAILSIIMTFDVYGLPNKECIELYGTKGSMTVPDPNGFGGGYTVATAGTESLKSAINGADVKMHYPAKISNPVKAYSQNSRALGLADMAKALQTGRDARASVNLTYHVLEVLSAMETASAEGKTVIIESAKDFKQPAPLPLDQEQWVLGS